MEKEERNITIHIDAVTHKLRIPIGEDTEECYRKAETLLNQRVEVYKKKFPNMDIWQMVAYEMAVEYQKLMAQYHTTPLREMQELMNILGQEDDGQ